MQWEDIRVHCTPPIPASWKSNLDIDSSVSIFGAHLLVCVFCVNSNHHIQISYQFTQFRVEVSDSSAQVLLGSQT